MPEWDKLNDRLFESGIDHAILYPVRHEDGSFSGGVPWNGLISVSQDPSGGEVEGFFFDGVKYFDNVASDTFQATITAYTYPDEFAAAEGFREIGPNLYVPFQTHQVFALSYRTKLCRADGKVMLYKAHLIYNCTVAPTSRAFETDSESSNPSTFSWTINATPNIPGSELINSSPGSWRWPAGEGMLGWPNGPDGNGPIPGWGPTPYIMVEYPITDPSPILPIDMDPPFDPSDPTTFPILPSPITIIKTVNNPPDTDPGNPITPLPGGMKTIYWNSDAGGYGYYKSGTGTITHTPPTQYGYNRDVMGKVLKLSNGNLLTTEARTYQQVAPAAVRTNTYDLISVWPNPSISEPVELSAIFDDGDSLWTTFFTNDSGGIPIENVRNYSYSGDLIAAYDVPTIMGVANANNSAFNPNSGWIFWLFDSYMGDHIGRWNIHTQQIQWARMHFQDNVWELPSPYPPGIWEGFQNASLNFDPVRNFLWVGYYNYNAGRDGFDSSAWPRQGNIIASFDPDDMNWQDLDGPSWQEPAPDPSTYTLPEFKAGIQVGWENYPHVMNNGGFPDGGIYIASQIVPDTDYMVYVGSHIVGPEPGAPQYMFEPYGVWAVKLSTGIVTHLFDFAYSLDEDPDQIYYSESPGSILATKTVVT